MFRYLEPFRRGSRMWQTYRQTEPVLAIATANNNINILSCTVLWRIIGPIIPRCMECTRGLAMTILSVCPSVCLSNAWFVTKRKNDVSRLWYLCERSLSLVFWEEEWLVGATTSTWNFGSTGPRWSEIADFQSIFARSPSEVAPSKKKFS